ncbi:MAG: hypothetical protein M3Y65_17020 [Pseudomonadota bacterium]|nr:hypothetical protein [Pseudomonadota bacterium]
MAIIDEPVPDEMGLRRIGVEIERGFKSGAFVAHEYYAVRALAELAGRKRDHALASARNALRLAQNNTTTKLNSLVVFSCTVAVDDALPVLADLFANHSDSKFVLRLATLRAIDFLQFDLAVAFAEKYEMLAANDADKKVLMSKQLMRSASAAKQLGLKDCDLSARIQVAVTVLIDRGYEILRHSRLVLPDASLVFGLHVDASADVCAELNFDIADAIVAEFDDPAAEFLTVCCRPLVDVQEMTAVRFDS